MTSAFEFIRRMLERQERDFPQPLYEAPQGYEEQRLLEMLYELIGIVC